MKILNTPSWSLDAEDDRKIRRANRSKAQSGAFAEATLTAAQEQLDFALHEPDLSDAERGHLLGESQLERRRAKRQQRCAAGFRLRTVGVDVDTSTLLATRQGFPCRRPTCGLCARQAARKLYDKLVLAYDRALDRKPGMVALHLTLTQRPYPTDGLGAAIDTLHAALRKFLKFEAITAAVEGTFRRTEITWNRDAKHWHVHAHLILLVKGPYGPTSSHWLAQPKLVELWGAAIGIDGFVVVNIKLVYDRASGDTDPDGVRRGLIHVAKYLTKPAGLFETTADGDFVIDPAIASALSKGVHRRRSYAFSGIFASRWKPKR